MQLYLATPGLPYKEHQIWSGRNLKMTTHIDLLWIPQYKLPTFRHSAGSVEKLAI